jgi:hypothetical protein
LRVNRVGLTHCQRLPVFPPEADIVTGGRHVSKVPFPEVTALIRSLWRGAVHQRRLNTPIAMMLTAFYACVENVEGNGMEI